MRVTFAESAKPDLAWFRIYYGSVFRPGGKTASEQFLRTIANLRANPYIGHPVGDEGLRELSVPRTPFSIIYRILEDRIEVARLWDQRSDPEGRGFQEEVAEFA